MRRQTVAAVTVIALLSLPSAAFAQSDEAELERAGRVPDILTALGVRDGAHIADLGSGNGFYTLRIAKAVAPTGRAYAIDIEQPSLDKLKTRAASDGITNVDIIVSEVADPKLPAARLDAVLIRNAYHEMTEHRSILKGVMTGLKPGGVLVVIEAIHDNLRTASREQQVKEHEISSDFVASELKEAGFQIIDRDDAFTTFTRPPPGGFWMIRARRP